MTSGTLLARIRSAELALVLSHLPPKGRVLELGGGNGYQAQLLARRGYDVVSLDVPTRPVHERDFYEIEVFDGRHIPYPDDSFDVVFSSNVLEHVIDLATLLPETRRVLRRHGVAVHLMPTPAWRLWTSLTWISRLPATYLNMLRDVTRRRTRSFLASRKQGNEFAETKLSATESKAADRPSFGHRILQHFSAGYILPGPHGESGSALHELFTFRRKRWIDELERAGFRVGKARPAGLFYTGDLLFEWMSLSVRRYVAPLLGSACCIYVARPDRLWSEGSRDSHGDTAAHSRSKPAVDNH